MGFATDAVHGGQQRDPATGAVSVPIYQTSTFAQEALGKHKGYEYARTSNPTRAALERSLAVLENGCAAFAFASGMAAIHALLGLFRAGDHVVCSRDIYGGTARLFDSVLSQFGMEFSYVDSTRVPDMEAAIRASTRLMYIETPANPLMTITDIREVAKMAHARGLLVAADNTFMTPYFQRPLDLGADAVVHSTTKYLNGHSDGVGGAVVMARGQEALAGRLQFLQNAGGAILGPFDSWLVLRGIKTLPLRMRQHNENASAIAKWLASQQTIKRVCYPGLKDHPRHDIAATQMSGFGGMLSFDLGSLDAAKRMLERLRLCTLAESLGGVETLVAHPATMSHHAIGAEARKRLGIGDGLLRLSVGIEDADDIIGDLKQALA